MNYMKIFLILLSIIVVIPAMAQEDDCVEMQIKIESTKHLDWDVCYSEHDESLLIDTSSEESNDNKITLQKDIFWNYNLDCSPAPFFTLVNGEEIDAQEEYFDDYRILSIPLEKGENKIEIIMATIPGLTANERCSNLNGNLKPLTLKQQLDGKIAWVDIVCPNSVHILTQRPSGDLACVYPTTAEKLMWKLVQ